MSVFLLAYFLFLPEMTVNISNLLSQTDITLPENRAARSLFVTSI